MNVFILTEGNKETGFGHITRCTSIYQVFEEKGFKPLFIINGDNTVEDLLKDLNYKIINWIENINEIIHLLKDNIAVIDSYKANQDIYKTISENAYKCLYLDDDNRIEYPKGFVLNAAISANKLNYPKKDDITYLLGEKYILLRKEFWNIPEKIINNQIQSILLTFGGNDIRNLTPKILKLLCNKFPDIKKNIIIGKAYKNIEEIKELSDNNTNLFFNPNTKEIIDIMLNSDIAISAGGQTIYELAITGTPIIAVLVIENQLENIKGLFNKEIIDNIIYHNDINIISKIENEINKFNDYKFRKEKSIKLLNLIDSKNNKRITDLLI